MKPIASMAPLLLSLALICRNQAQEKPDARELAAALKKVSPHVAAESEREQLRSMLGGWLRERIAAANRKSSEDWSKIRSAADWDLFSRERITALRQMLQLPPRDQRPRYLVTGQIQGEGFRIQNLVFESRPGLVVTANLYVPDPLRAKMPGIVLSHSHHNPKHQGELQDMGMTWARAGCYVLVADHLGHGERRQHPFATAADYAGEFQLGRQDYYFRYDTSMQLHAAGQSLMSWMVHDLMTGIDLLHLQTGIDTERIILLGSVAGGGDPAAVTAAVDDRIDCVVPFNFGGPQPESRYPLPEDAETSFNYAGSGSWESTRNLWRSAGDGFLPWVIVGSVSSQKRHLIHAHEFSWDQLRDPVWKRLEMIWAMYGQRDRLAFAHGQGTLTSTDPPGSHCNNIGPAQRRQIHEAFRTWFGIGVKPEDEYSSRRTPEGLACLSEAARNQFHPKPLYEVLTATILPRSPAVSMAIREDVRRNWTTLLGKQLSDVPPNEVVVRDGSPPLERTDGLIIQRQLLAVEPGITVPVLIIKSNHVTQPKRRPIALGVAMGGIASILAERRDELADLLARGVVVALVDVRGSGATSPGNDHGQQGASTAHSATCLMLGETLLGNQLRDLRAVWRQLTRRDDADPRAAAVFGHSSMRPLAADARFSYPRRIDGRPPECQPGGALLALLLALFEDDISMVETCGGLVSFASLLESPFVQVPHECIVPGATNAGDLPTLVASLAPRRVTLDGLVDGRGRAVPLAASRTIYAPAARAYARVGAAEKLDFVQAGEQRLLLPGLGDRSNAPSK
jgi:dienelactone hydrolase